MESTCANLYPLVSYFVQFWLLLFNQASWSSSVHLYPVSSVHLWTFWISPFFFSLFTVNFFLFFPFFPLFTFFTFPLRRSIMESKWPLVVPHWSLIGFWHNGFPKDTPRKLHINFQLSTYLGSAPSPMCLQSVILDSRRKLLDPKRILGAFWHTGCPTDASNKLQINFQKSFPIPGSSKASSKCHPWSLRGCWRFLRGIFVVFGIMDVI